MNRLGGIPTVSSRALNSDSQSSLPRLLAQDSFMESFAERTVRGFLVLEIEHNRTARLLQGCYVLLVGNLLGNSSLRLVY